MFLFGTEPLLTVKARSTEELLQEIALGIVIAKYVASC